MKTAIIVSALALAAVFFQSCKKEADPPFIYVSPTSSVLETTPGGLIEFTIRAYAGDNGGQLRVQVLSKPNNSFTSTILDTLVYAEVNEFFYRYYAPDGGAEDVLLTFRVIDSDGLSNATLRRITIEGNAYLTQTTGHLLYSGYNLSALNGFDIDLLQPVNLASLADSSGVDLFEFDVTDDETMSRSLSSYSGIKFVRNNSFNYAEATNQSAEASFISSTPQSIVSNIQTDDILITRYDTLANRYAVLRIVSVSDEPGVNGDKYEFNIKK